MTTLVALRMLLNEGEVLIGSSLIVALVMLLPRRKSASEQHLVWAVVFAALALLPLLITLLPSLTQLHISPGAAPPQFVPVTEQGLVTSAPVGRTWSFDASMMALSIACVWVAGLCVFLLRLAAATICLAQLKRRSRPYALAPQDLPQIPATKRECELRLAASEHGPITWGVRQPVILLPRSATTWPRDRLHAVLLHELAHVRRRDSLVQTLACLTCAFYWLNPLVWIAARALRREAEMAADDAVVRGGMKPSVYAGALLKLASDFRAQTPAVSMLPLSMAAPSALKARVESVLTDNRSRQGVTPMNILQITGAAFVVVSALCVARPSLAQDDFTTTAASSSHEDIAAPGSPRIIVDGRDFRHLTPAEQKRARIAIAKAARETREAIAKVAPEIERAISDAHIAVTLSRPEVENALAEVRREQPEIEKAMSEVAKEQPEIAREMAAARPQIDAAMAKARAELARENIDAEVRAHVDEALAKAQADIEKAHARMRENATPDLPDPATPESN